MVFKTITFDVNGDINSDFPPSPDSSPPSTLCLPLTRRCTRSISVESQRKPEEPSSISPSEIDFKFPEQKQLRRFTYKELRQATGNFSSENALGEGAFGKVYKGRLSSGYLVAVKRSNRKFHSGCLKELFQAEVQVGKLVMHRNVVPMIGFCEGTNSKERHCLLYPFIPNGSLMSYLGGPPRSLIPLDWPARKHVALGLARGLSYLHDNCFLRIIHHDIKPSNILLDENLEPRIADFGTAKFMHHSLPRASLTAVPYCIAGRSSGNPVQKSQGATCSNEGKTTHLWGTPGYMAPEFSREGTFSVKNDVYAYGVTLLAIVSGCSPSDLRRLAVTEGFHATSVWVKKLFDSGNLGQIIDSSMRGEYDEAEVETLIKLALLCSQDSPAKRPNMSEVVVILEGSNCSLGIRWEEFERKGIRDAEEQIVTDREFSPEELSCPR
ncbi:somatic embryogenesis receptor kinase 4-like [Punica granatum]|uniref:non-specific serine/threonine protein kinase n=2 Tax=Punica granatum TaxID=22663 RepID=A0A2I0HMU1_PUNGR|nr:somatic embryogenesis receptor kinase 4-like [Punica granatum]PKI32606.1 hypothetical protein CRG98_047003 [Punica granatum]